MINEYVFGVFSSSKCNVNNAFTSTKCNVYEKLSYKFKNFLVC